MLNENQCKLINVTIDDCDLLFNWVNDYEVRANSFNTNKIEYEEHVEWFKFEVIQNSSNMYILKVKNEKVGLVRLNELSTNEYLISYSIAKEYRGKGFGTMLLRLIKEKHSSRLLIGKVKKDNIGSIKAFQNAGYCMKEEPDMYIFYSTNYEL